MYISKQIITHVNVKRDGKAKNKYELLKDFLGNFREYEYLGIYPGKIKFSKKAKQKIYKCEKCICGTKIEKKYMLLNNDSKIVIIGSTCKKHFDRDSKLQKKVFCRRCNKLCRNFKSYICQSCVIKERDEEEERNMIRELKKQHRKRMRNEMESISDWLDEDGNKEAFAKCYNWYKKKGISCTPLKVKNTVLKNRK